MAGHRITHDAQAKKRDTAHGAAGGRVRRFGHVWFLSEWERKLDYPSDARRALGRRRIEFE